MPLWVVATPIGNVADLSPRARDLLANAAVVLCEDTRRTDLLYRAIGVAHPRLVSCYAQNEAARIDEAMAILATGADVVLVSDAGTPGISDPGGRIVEAAHAAGVEIHAVAGPSAIAAALSVSGFNATPFHFLGFPPRKAGDRRRFAESAQALEGTLGILEAGRRVPALLDEWAALDPDRGVVIARELTKTYEQIVRGTLASITRGPFLGEVVVVLGPRTRAPERAALEVGEGLTGVAQALADRWGTSRKEAYQALLRLESERSTKA